MNETQPTNQDLVNQAIKAVTDPPLDASGPLTLNPDWGLMAERSSVATNLSVLALRCTGTLGDLLNGVLEMANEEFVSVSQDREFWRKSWGKQVDETNELLAQREALVAEVLRLRALEEDEAAS